MIDAVIEKWHQHMRGQLPGGLDELLDDDCVFLSPIVYTPQQGKAVTKLYLEAAGQTLPGDASTDGGGSSSSGGGFRYTKEVLAGDTAVLEFETTVKGKYVNGVDIITCNDEGRIVEFRVMIRPGKLSRPVPVPEELRLLDAVLDEPVEEYMARPRHAAAVLRERREERDAELYRRVGLPPFDYELAPFVQEAASFS